MEFFGSPPQPLGGRNAIINGAFAINQRGYASGASLAAGAYAHDRWKVGGNGGGYTFSQGSPDTTVTMTSGTLVQAVDAGNVVAASMWLTWAGSAQARVWQGSASGAYSAGTPFLDPLDGAKNRLLVTGLAPGTIAAVEFGTGTLGLVQLEAAGATPTSFERRHGELTLCQRYFELLGAGGNGYAYAGDRALIFYRYAVPKRASPTLTGLKSNPAIFQQAGGGYQSAANATYSFGSVAATDTQGFSCIISGFSGLQQYNPPIVINDNNIIASSAEI